MTVRLLAAALALACLPAPPASAARPLVEVTSQRTAFSPNGDGRKDTLPVRFRLAEPARVAVRIAEVGTVDLGRLEAGRHVWTWDGRGAADGVHQVVVRARTDDGRTGRDRHRVQIDRGQGLADVRIHLTRRTLHPQTPGKEDRIYVHSTKDGNATEVRIRDADGDVVVDERFWHWWSWDGSGLPAGEYAATFSLNDRFGNVRDIERTLRISAEPLVQETWTTTVDAADVPLVATCGTAPSTVYEDGLVVAPGPGCDRATLVPRFAIPVDIDPDVTWRLTVTGSGDVTQVFVASGIDVVVTPTPEGPGTTTTPWGGPHDYAWDPDRDPGVAGYVAVEDEGDSYDVAELTLEVRYWTTSTAAAATAASASAPRGPTPSPATAPSR